ncbi:MAG: class I adenylate-forming enzyme family protein [Pseudomonadota bacterium]
MALLDAMSPAASVLSCGTLFVGDFEVKGSATVGRAAALAALMVRWGINPGDRVAIAVTDPVPFSTALAACLGSGIAAVVLDPQADPAPIAAALRRLHPAAMILDAGLMERLLVVPEIALPAHGVVVGRDSRRPGLRNLFSRQVSSESVPSWPAFSDIAAKAGEAMAIPADIDDTLPAVIAVDMTGGGSAPRAHALSRSALAVQAETISTLFGMSRGDALLSCVPRQSLPGLLLPYGAGLLGGMTVQLPEPDAGGIDADALPDLLRTRETTHLLAPVALLEAAVAHPGQASFGGSTLRHVVVLAEDLAPALRQQAEAAFACRVSSLFGPAGTTGSALFCGPAPALSRPDSLGKALDGAARIADGAGEALPIGRPGRLQLKGPAVMQPLADTDGLLEDGWLDTGLPASIDAEGFVHRAR